MDKIRIEDLQIYAHHGVYPKENEIGQNFYISVELETDTRRAGVMDDLNLSTNYGDVCRFLHSFLTTHTYKLIETAAERAAEKLLLTFPHVRRVTMEVKKPEAPIPFPFRTVSVRITRGWRRTYIACGSNMGDREAHLKAAVDSFQVQCGACLRLDGDDSIWRRGAGRFSKWCDSPGYALYPGRTVGKDS